MKKKSLFIFVLAMLLYVCGSSVSAEAISIPDGYSSTYYTQFMDVLIGVANPLKGGELIDLTNDQIPELVLVYNGDNSPSVCVAAYQHDALSSQAKLIFEHEYSLGSFCDESSLTIRNASAQNIISVWYNRLAHGGTEEGYDYTTIDDTMEESSISLRKYYFNVYDFIDSRGNSLWDFENYEGSNSEMESLKDAFYAEYRNVEYSYYKNDVEITKEEYEQMKQSVENNSIIVEIPNCYSTLDSIDKNEVILQFLNESINAKADEAAEKIIESSYPLSEVTYSFSESEKIEIGEFIQLFDSVFNYDGKELDVERLVYKLYTALMNSDYYSSRYDYQKNGNSLQISVSELDRLISDIFNTEIIHKDLTVGDVEYNETLSMVFSGDMVTLTDNGYYEGERFNYEELMRLYQISDDIYYGIFRGSEFDYISPLGFAVLQKRIENGTNYWRCLYAGLDGSALSADVLQQYVTANTQIETENISTTEPSSNNAATSELVSTETTTRKEYILPIMICMVIIVIGGVVWMKKNKSGS